eukprot:TRINITY_DN3991_c0_g1_i1.p1 TRINITY_DN3991_c0_g1~~TRINITY_DN3991_c0_g1_i1.p1  ORF type:complete len:208 (-),score=18.87 TRINITY_DN3991_c0_g1_i1:248-871(-)
MAGKTIEDIRKEAAEDLKSKLAAEQQASSLHMPSQAESHYMTPYTPSLSQAIPDRKFGSWAGVSSSSPMPQGPGQGHHRDHVPMLPGSSALSHKPKVSFPSFLDDLRLGFPCGGLSRASQQWWGSKDGGVQSRWELGAEGEGEEEGKGSAASVLARKRRRGAVSGRRALRLALSRGYGAHKLGDKDSQLLKSVFGNYLPCRWQAGVV